MSKLAILRLLGDLEQGVQVVLTIGILPPSATTAVARFPTDSVSSTEINGRLPPNACLLQAIEQWQSSYRQLDSTRIRPNQITYDTSIYQRRLACKKLERELRSQFHQWLLSESFRPIRDRWLRDLMEGEVQAIIRATDRSLLKLPWQLWDLIEQNPLAEVALSIADAEAIPKAKRSALRDRLKVLAILGNRKLGNETSIDLERDRYLLESSVDPPPQFLDEPNRREINDRLWERNWDILFFAGHSRTEGEKGRIYINQTDSLTISELKYAVKKAVEKGLWLGIFNSCDGMGLAFELQQLHLPQAIVMREPVSDPVAHTFLAYFLPKFIETRSLYLAQREARLRLQGLENEFPCASWLPVLFQNSVEIPPHAPERSLWQRWRSALLISVAVAAGVIGIRQSGMLQPMEWQAFDRLQLLRPPEPPDPRLLVVAIAESDVQQRKEYPASDRTLSQALSKLERYQPQAIGLDIYRDFPVPQNDRDGHRALLSNLLSPRLVGVCAVPTPGQKGVPAPPLLFGDRLGFSDIVTDDDGILRRHLLFLQPDLQSPCQTAKALSLQLALRYLAARGIKPQVMPHDEYRIQNTIFTPLSERRGSYRTTDLRGYQILLNYRVFQSPEKVAPQVTLSQVLNNQIKPQMVKGKIVLIGVTAESVPDRHLTPYGSLVRPQQRSPGVLVQAQMTSQILSAVLDGRPLLWVWPDWAEGLWIVGWSVVGGILAISARSRLQLVLAMGGAVVVLIAICWGSLLLGGWLPLVPSALVLAVTGALCLWFGWTPAIAHRRV